MAENHLTIGRGLTTPSPGGAIGEELRQALWERCRLLFVTGLAISAIAAAVNLLVPSAYPQLVSDLARFDWVTGALAHAATFALALGALYLMNGSSGQLQALAFITVAINIVLGIYNQAVFSPATAPYFVASLLLFLPAAFVPWRTSYQVAIGATAVVWLVLLETLLYVLVPEAKVFWAERGGLEAARNHTIWSATGITILAGASVVVSRTLYTVRKTALKARKLGNYLIHGELGSGGMGDVLVAQHALLVRPTALKVLRANGDDRTALARFEREVRLSATLTHPNTITIYDVGRTADNSLYYAMEYLEGMDLQKLVEKFGPIPPARAVYLLTQICGSLSEAHSRDIIHRDIKPGNIFLTRRGGLYDFVKVLDFGLAKQIESDASAAITKTGILFGTPRYLAPETVYGDDRVDGRVDLYGLGGVAYWLLAGQPPFTAESSVELVVDHVKTIPKRPSEVSELSIPPELDDIVMKCLEKKPEDRYQTARELQKALEAVPFATPWSGDKAREWWSLHGIISDDALDCECFFHDDILPDLEELPPLPVESSA